MAQRAKQHALVESDEVILMEITPTLAAEWISQNPRNRSISKNLVATYARVISNDHWKVNGETIKIAPSGDLVDGQHRLMACVHAKKPFVSYVAFGVDPENFDTIDTGRGRQAGDILSIAGVSNSRAVASAVRWFIAYRTKASSSRVAKATPDEVLAEYQKIPEISDSFYYASKTTSIVQKSIGIFCHYMFAQKDEEEANTFFLDLSSGANLAANDPVLRLREALLRNRASKARLPPQEIATRVIRAWNLRRTGREVAHVKGRVKASDKTAKHLPEIG